ncbi:hemolysin family protein [Brackiella oedipodis]|uniref:hemolysin family protein n=1 Tax=Brackiella oedipodis TaxID=124225 RepID=UPI0004900843|nr:hemolysin family protein [Brackiella oedipodis]
MLNLIAILVLILVNAIFVMAEIAIVTAKRMRLQHEADQGKRSAKVALSLIDNPTKALSTTQIGITLIGIFVGAMGEASLVSMLQPYVESIPGLANYAYQISLFIVVMGITFVSLIIGELVPKRIGMQYAEQIAAFFAIPMKWLSTIVSPFVWVLSFTTELILKLLRFNRHNGDALTEEDINSLLKEGATAGLFEKTEHDIVARALSLDDKPVASIMTPRNDIHYIDLKDSLQDSLTQIADSPYSRFVVCEDDLDNVVGIIDAGTLFEQQIRGQPINIRELTRPAKFVPETISAMDLLETLQQQRSEIAVVINEYGEVEGVCTLRDILKVLVGYTIPLNEDQSSDFVYRADGSWSLDASIDFDRFREILETDTEFPGEDEDYHTLAGFIFQELGHIPEPKEHFTWQGYYFEVLTMDKHRIDRVLVRAPQSSKDMIEESDD